jgi:uncharacterized protein GlcG (DUF336 family)
MRIFAQLPHIVADPLPRSVESQGRTAKSRVMAGGSTALYPLLAVSGGRYSAMGGGVPLTSADQVIDGIGVSG